MTDVCYDFDPDVAAPIDDSFWDALEPLNGDDSFHGTFRDHSRPDAVVVVVAAPAAPVAAPQKVSPMDGEYAGLALVDNAAQGAVRDDAAAAFSADGLFFSGAPSSFEAWSSLVASGAYQSLPVDDTLFCDSLGADVMGYDVPDGVFAPLSPSAAEHEAFFSVRSSELSFSPASSSAAPAAAAAFSDAPLPGFELDVASVSDDSMPMDTGVGGDDDDDDDGACSPMPSEGGRKAFHGGILPHKTARRCASIARDSILAAAERENAPSGRRAGKRFPVASPPASSPVAQSMYTPLSARRRFSAASESSSSSSLFAPPSPGAESDVGDTMSDDDRIDDDEQRKVRRVSLKVPRHLTVVDLTTTDDDDDDEEAPEPSPRVVLDLCGDDDKLVQLNPREHSAPAHRRPASPNSSYGGRTVRTLPKPALMYGAVRPPAGEYPPALVVRSGSAGKTVHTEHNETLGYKIAVRSNARDWGRNLVAGSVLKMKKHMTVEGKQEKAWHTKMCNLYEQEIERVLTAWRVFYGMDENPPMIVVARDLTLMWRWIVDTHGESTGTGKDM